MAVDWQRMPLGDFVTLQRGHDLPEGRRREGRVPILGSFGITGYHDESRAPGPGITVGRSGASFGVVSYSKEPFWPLNTALFVRDFHGNDERFAYYFLKSLDFKRFNSGSAQPSLNRNFIHPIMVAIPPLHEQRAIASILGALDDKIELNRKTGATLEALARALFKSWFVDFDPVRAKAEGRDTGLSTEVAALFPDSLDRSELGLIPRGWRATALSAIMTFEGGSQPAASAFISKPKPGFVRLVQIRDFYTDSHLTYVPESTKLRKFRIDDVMIARYGSSGGGANGSDSLGRICRGLSGAYNVALVKVIPKIPVQEFLYYFLRTDAFRSRIVGMGARSVQSGFRKEDLNVIPVTVGPSIIHDVFEDFAGSIWRRTFQASQESKTLATIRDALLPKLMSGKIRVGDAERIVAKSA